MVEPKPEKVKLLQQEKVIRFSGLLMMISPFANFFLSVIPVQNVGDKTSLPVLMYLAKSISMTHWILWAGSFVVGSMMLKGRRSSWISVLVILGLFIVFDFWHLKRDLVRGWEQPVISITANLLIFILVYVQEFRQSSAPRRPVVQPRPAPVVQAAPVVPIPVPVQQTLAPVFEIRPNQPNLIGHLIDFDGLGPWARIVNMDRKELFLKAFREPPPELGQRTVEIDIGQETYRLRMTSRQGELFTFRFEAVSQKKKPKLRLVS